MGNQPSKDGLIDNTNQKRIRSIGTKSGLLKQQQQQELEINRVSPSKSSSRLLQRRNNSNNNVPVVVSPVRHQLVLNDHVTPLVSLSAASNSYGIYQQQRRGSGRDTRSMSSTSITSEEGEPNTPTFYHRSSCDEFAHSFMQDLQTNNNKLSTSLPTQHSDEFIINSPSSSTWTTSANRRTSGRNNNRDSRELWVYEYGAEKERDR